MAYNIQIKFEDSWIWVISGVGLSDKCEKAIFDTLEDAEAFTSHVTEGYYKIVPIND